MNWTKLRSLINGYYEKWEEVELGGKKVKIPLSLWSDDLKLDVREAIESVFAGEENGINAHSSSKSKEYIKGMHEGIFQTMTIIRSRIDKFFKEV